MIEIKGKYNSALCFAETIEESAINQIRSVCDVQAFADSKIRIMPDAHTGNGCTIGTTMTVKDKVVPSLVGVDIGCGMLTVKLGKVAIDFKKMDEVVRGIPSGKAVWDGRKERFDLTVLRCFRSLKDSKRLERSLGTLGGGNHFIEVDQSEDDEKYLVIHSGSRNLGKQVADIYQKLAVELNQGKEEFFKRRAKLIEEYKQSGRRSEIQSELKKMENNWKDKVPSLPKDLCYLYGEYMENYLHDLEICQKFARRNREKIAEIILEEMGIEMVESFQTVHNYIDIDEKIIRKGAVSAKKGEKLLIPINMRDGSLLCIGKGNEDWNFSAPHGAGRLLSRTEAFEKLSMEEYQREMAGIYTTSVTFDTLDESPMAYKNMDEIVRTITPTAEIIDKIRPLYNFKATE